MKYLQRGLCVLFIGFCITAVFSQQAYAEKPLALSDTKVVYDLPYPGVLPDHPLFFLKELKNVILEIVTRDPVKKAEFLLVLSDKQVSIAQALADKGKVKQALTYLTKAEAEFSRLLMLLRASKQQGVAPYEGFLYKLQLSNIKHREVIDSFLKDLPQGQESQLIKIVEANDRNKEAIVRFN